LDRNPNYDIKKYPEKWNDYKNFTTAQLSELMNNYGKIDILWLDGGWVRPDSLDEYKNARIKNNQDIDMNSIVKKLRKSQPELIVVDRDVPTENQNYLTPEQQLPDTLLSYPWETCMTMATSWSWVPNDKYKSSMQLIQTLAKIVSMGGNFLLNIAPNADGEWDSTAYVRLQQMGDWMKINGEAIYNTKPIYPYRYKNFVFTQHEKSIYAIYLKQNEDEKFPNEIELPVFNQKIKNAELLENAAVKLNLKNDTNHLKLKFNSKAKIKSSEAWVIRLKF
jgi:alpha-L-fucosidase